MFRSIRGGRVLALAGAALLSACANNEKMPSPVTTIAAHDCAASPDLAKATVLVFNAKDETKQVADIVETTPCMTSTAGPAMYVAYALPQAGAAYVIGVASPARGSTLFAPHVMLLGADGSVKREYSGKQLDFRGEGLGVRVRNHPDEVYLVVASDPGYVGQDTTRINEATQVYTGATAYGTYQIHTGSESHDTYIYAHNGRVIVTITPIAPPK